MRQLWFHDPLIMFVLITFPMHQVLCSSASFPMLPYFFNFILIIVGGGANSTCCSLNCGLLHLVSRSLLNMLCIIHPSGSSSWNAPKLMSLEILKGLYLFWCSFFESLFKWIFLFSNHTLSPIFNSWGFLCFLSNYFFVVSYAVSIDFVASFQLLCRPVRNSSNLENSVCTMRLPFYGCLPKLSSKGVLPVAMCLLSLYWNSVAASHFVQLSC